MKVINNKKILVSIKFKNEIIKVGELISDGAIIFFKYFDEFITTGLQISPFKLPLHSKIYQAESIPFEGLFGVFNDSLPDGWGRLLLDRKFFSKRMSLSQISPLDRLAFVGNNGLGALIYEPSNEFQNLIFSDFSLDELASEMDFVLKGNSSDIIEELYQLGGSSGGARPKIMIGYNPLTEEIMYGNQELPDGFEHWIIKFPSTFDSIDCANIEFAYYKMACEAGIEMATCKLFVGKSGKHYFGTKRFDRIQNKRIHLHSASGLLNDNFRLSSFDYGHLMDAAFRLEKQASAYDKTLRLAAFNVFSNNRDDHSKNFSFLMDEQGNWRFAPAYDLTYSNSSHGMHSTMVAGESKNPSKKHLLDLAKNFSMKRADIIIEEVQNSLSTWTNHSKNCGVSKESEIKIQKAISNLLKF